MTTRRTFTAIAFACGLLALTGCSEETTTSAPAVTETAPQGIEDADPRLQAIYKQADQLLPGGKNAFRKRIAELKGIPIVVNKWASWCGPCAAEFPLFQQQARRRGAEIAFLGVNTNDADDEAEEFLRKYPVPFPSYLDGRASIAAEFDHVVAFPTTAFYDVNGRLVYVHQGQFQNEAQLQAEIDRYALRKAAT